MVEELLAATRENSNPILVVQHVPCETLGTIEHALTGCGLTTRTIRVYADDPVPKNMNGACGLIVMGGPMSVYDCGRLDHLRQEMRLITSALMANRPVLGVCLGSQLLAHVLGGRVYPGPRKEIGWHPVRGNENLAKDPLWSGTPSPFQAFHWHGDVFDLPSGCTSLAASDQTACQAFRSGTTAFGILFHMEVTESLIDDIAACFPHELAEVGGNLEQLRRGAQDYLPQLTAIGDRFFRGWAKLVLRSVGRTTSEP